MLYLVATPIGNLADFSFRAVDVLKSCDYILCEDTRHSLALLQAYDIHKPLKSFHKFNEAFRESTIIDDLSKGGNIALISDAGTPGISDPGSRLVACCIANNIAVTAIPGPCAAIQALCCSGLATERFQFWGFLPKKASALKQALIEILNYPSTTVCYESPHRLLPVLEVLHKLEATRQIVVAREMTKKFEEIQRGTAAFLLEQWRNREPKGEIVLLIGGKPADIRDEEWQSWTPQEHVEYIQKNYQLSKQEAIKMVAKMRGVPKREIYSQNINL